MLPNEVFALECLARYAKEGLVVDSSNGQFAHCPYPRPKGQKKRLAGDLGYWLTFNDHQHQGLLQSVDVGRRCYFIADVKLYLDTYPPNYFELYDIYDKFNSGEYNSQFGVPHTEEWKKVHSERMTGEKHPNYGNRGAVSSNRKAIIAIQPDGTKLHFSSVSEAARELGTHDTNLCRRYLIPGKQPKYGKFEGWQFFYAE